MAAEIPVQWRNWLHENLLGGVAPEQLVATMQANHFELNQINGALIEMIRDIEGRIESQSTYIPPEPCDGLDKPWSVSMQMRRPVVVQTYKNVLSNDECQGLIKMARHKLEPSYTINQKSGELEQHPYRTSSGTFFKRGDTELLRTVEDRISEIMNIPVNHGEDMQILRYGIGAEYRPHFDYFPPQNKGSDILIKHSGQRVATLLLYLNDVEEGGETIFPHLNLKVAPLKGTALYFSYFHLGHVNPNSLHGGAPVIQGEKWVATKWMHEKPI